MTNPTAPHTLPPVSAFDVMVFTQVCLFGCAMPVGNVQADNLSDSVRRLMILGLVEPVRGEHPHWKETPLGDQWLASMLRPPAPP